MTNNSLKNNRGDWREQFKAIDSLLTQTRQYWQILPFSFVNLPWSDNRELIQALDMLSLDDIDKLDSDDHALRQFLSPLIGESLDIITDLPVKPSTSADVAPHFNAGIKGRKWSQIQHFSSFIKPENSPILEWCAGKGHLGRLVAKTQQRDVLSLEWQKSLCEQGNVLAKKHDVSQQVVEADVFDNQVKQHVKSCQHAIALHACGDLHTQLLKVGSEKALERVSIAPCCYHLIKAPHYQALSSVAAESSLKLSKLDLSLSMQQSVVSATREQRHRYTEVCWRLAFDVLQRQIRNVDEYLPLPSIKQSILTGSFEAFCQWAAAQKNLLLPQDVDFNRLEAQGFARFIVNRKIEVVTHAFRQLLERWLLLDRVLYLEEQGYEVALFNFCESSITPRNAMIQGIKKPAS
ncbi:SAM-dependent methyltransferase [Psychrobium sp. MM17-31]|uniref:methyltransferase n=1 Tax=Psychrobium sp. MM17-31 TaxID=2917758 RepID=UPI001EF4462E|nr:methyltransferase [Psychrobium sp. MM17-31]MCG7532607.1 SAM-dependent methyltransferase [Psychrobium sp. MM17-31]